MLPLPVCNLSQVPQDHAECGGIADFVTQPQAFLQGFRCPLLGTSEPQAARQQRKTAGEMRTIVEFSCERHALLKKCNCLRVLPSIGSQRPQHTQGARTERHRDLHRSLIGRSVRPVARSRIGSNQGDVSAYAPREIQN